MDREKVIERIHEAIDMGVCVDLFMDVLELLKEQEADIKNLNETIMNLLQKITEMNMIYGDCEYVGELVRCKDCKYYDSFSESCRNGIDGIMTPNFYCGNAERKGGS